MWSSFVFELDPTQRLDVALFNEVRNAAHLVKQLVSGNLEVALVNPLLVPSLLIVRAAAWKAIADARVNAMQTRNVHSELVFNLSPDNAITRSLKTFGISNTSETVLICLINATDAQRAAAENLIQGSLVPEARVEGVCHSELIKTTYQIESVEIEANSLVNAVLNRISSKVSKKNDMI